MTPDILATGANASVLRLEPVSDRGLQWLVDHVDAELWQWQGPALSVDHRCGFAVLEAGLGAGLYITLDGREPNASREAT